jgi:hypothetical protein
LGSDFFLGLKKSDFLEKSDFYLNLGRTPNCLFDKLLVKEIRFFGKIGFLFMAPKSHVHLSKSGNFRALLAQNGTQLARLRFA